MRLVVAETLRPGRILDRSEPLIGRTRNRGLVSRRIATGRDGRHQHARGRKTPAHERSSLEIA
jgi:hypothetical protein